MKSEYLFQTFFQSQDENCRFTDEGQLLAMQVLQIFEHQSHNSAKSSSPTYEVTENDVKSTKTKFNKILGLIEDAKEALMAIGMVEDHGICTEDAGIPEVTSQTNGVWDLVAIFVKASIGVALLDACWNPLLVGAIRTLVIGGSAIAAAIAAWRLSSDADHRNDCSGDDWDFRGAFVTYVQVIGGFILLLALIHPMAVLSGIVTLVFFGLLAFFGGIALWEIYFGNHLLESEEEDIFAIKEHFIKELSLSSWFESANQLSSAIEDATGHIVYVQSLNVAYALLSKVRETMRIEEWLNKYLNSTNSFCKLIERKYGSALAPVVIAFVLVVIIFDDRNRSLMDSVFKSRHFEKSAKPALDAKIFRCNFVSLIADLNNIQKKISKNSDEGTQRERNLHLNIMIAPIALDIKEKSCNGPEELIKNECDRNLMEVTKQDGLKTMSSSIDVQKNNTVEDQKYELNSPVNSEISDKKGKTHTIECQSNDMRKHRKSHFSELQIKNPLAYNRLSSWRNESNLCLIHNTNTKIVDVQKNNTVEDQKYESNSPESEISGKKGTTLSTIESQSNGIRKHRKVKYSELKIKNTLAYNRLSNWRNESNLCLTHKFLDNMESHQNPDIIGCDEKMMILEELEKRVESLLNDGKTTKNQWVVDLEERFVQIFS